MRVFRWIGWAAESAACGRIDRGVWVGQRRRTICFSFCFCFGLLLLTITRGGLVFFSFSFSSALVDSTTTGAAGTGVRPTHDMPARRPVCFRLRLVGSAAFVTNDCLSSRYHAQKPIWRIGLFVWAARAQPRNQMSQRLSIAFAYVRPAMQHDFAGLSNRRCKPFFFPFLMKHRFFLILPEISSS